MPTDRSDAWPELPYEAFAATARLLHMGLQTVGKLTLLKPSEPQWANVALLPTSRGLTTGPIPWHDQVFTVDVDFVAHALEVSASSGRRAGFALGPMSVADWLASLYAVLDAVGVEHRISLLPQEVPDPIPFDQDTELRPYDKPLVLTWWRALMSSYRVLQVHHGRFTGRTPPIGLLWGTFDVRDARYGGVPIATGGANATRDPGSGTTEWEAQVGWWPGSEAYPRPAYFAFTNPAPDGYERAAVRPSAARWDQALGEFVLDYDDVRTADDPEADLLAFCESTYETGASVAGRADSVRLDHPEPAPEGERS